MKVRVFVLPSLIALTYTNTSYYHLLFINWFNAHLPANMKSDKSVKNIIFIPIPDSVEKARASGRKYKLGEMILTK